MKQYKLRISPICSNPNCKNNCKPMCIAHYLRSEKHSCSIKCRGIARRERIKVICDYCGKIIERSPCHIHETSYCDRDCQKKAGQAVTNCGICGKEIIIKKCYVNKQNFCSKECFSKFCSIRASGNKNPNYGKHWAAGKGNPNYDGKLVTTESRKNQSIAMKKYYDSHPLAKEEMSERSKRQWQDPEFVKKWFKGHDMAPNKLEKFFDKITPDIVRYVGNKAWFRTINGKHKNPDFKVTGQDKVIEIFGGHWHKGENPQELINLYKQAGLDCLVFWEDEVYKQPNAVLEKVNSFIGANHVSA